MANSETIDLPLAAQQIQISFDRFTISASFGSTIGSADKFLHAALRAAWHTTWGDGE